jgi:hypothetical protein
MHLGAPFSALRKRQEASSNEVAPPESMTGSRGSLGVETPLAGTAPLSTSDGVGTSVNASQLDLKVRS